MSILAFESRFRFSDYFLQQKGLFKPIIIIYQYSHETTVFICVSRGLFLDSLLRWLRR